MRLKLSTKIGKRYYYTQAIIDDSQLQTVLDYVSNIKDINEYYNLVKSSSFVIVGKCVISTNDNISKSMTYEKRLFTPFCTVVVMDRNVKHLVHTPFRVYRNSVPSEFIKGHHSEKYKEECNKRMAELLA